MEERAKSQRIIDLKEKSLERQGFKKTRRIKEIDEKAKLVIN